MGKIKQIKKDNTELFKKIDKLQELTGVWKEFVDGITKEDLKDVKFIAAFTLYSRVHRDYMQMKNLGFGIEDCLKDLASPEKLGQQHLMQQQ